MISEKKLQEMEGYAQTLRLNDKWFCVISNLPKQIEYTFAAFSFDAKHVYIYMISLAFLIQKMYLSKRKCLKQNL